MILSFVWFVFYRSIENWYFLRLSKDKNIGKSHNNVYFVINQLMAFIDGNTAKCMLPAQNQKRLNDGDEGPITKGMGAYCPCPLINDTELEFSKNEIIERDRI